MTTSAFIIRSIESEMTRVISEFITLMEFYQNSGDEEMAEVVKNDILACQGVLRQFRENKDVHYLLAVLSDIHPSPRNKLAKVFDLVFAAEEEARLFG